MRITTQVSYPLDNYVKFSPNVRVYDLPEQALIDSIVTQVEKQHLKQLFYQISGFGFNDKQIEAIEKLCFTFLASHKDRDLKLKQKYDLAISCLKDLETNMPELNLNSVSIDADNFALTVNLCKTIVKHEVQKTFEKIEQIDKVV